MADQVGLGWRGELGAAILEHLDSIDVLEVIAEDWMCASRRDQRALRALAAERPLILHGVAMGLASAEPVCERRLARMARLVDTVRPAAWSEHLAFVRAGGYEIGHLAAPPRTPSTVEGALRNVERATAVVGEAPALENIATLVDPPGSVLDEPDWTRAIVESSGAPLLLDLHNLYANAVNFNADPLSLLRAMPLASVRFVHLSGGVWMRGSAGRPRLLDDHLHDVPDPVFALLEELARRAPQPLAVVVERDGCYPDFSVILDQLQRARAALAAGRARAADTQRKAA